MSEPLVFVPANDLERTLLQAKGGWATVPDFIAQMARGQVILAIDKDVTGQGWDNSATPLVLQTHEGGPGLCIFTSEQRIVPWLDRFPKFEYALNADFAWVLDSTQPGTAILINPGWEEGLIIRPESVQQMRQAQRDAAGRLSPPSVV